MPVFVRVNDFGDSPEARGADLALLDASELRRAEGFVHLRDRVRFVQRRAWLRLVLAPFADCAVTDLRFRSGARGKPELAGPGREVRFSLSWSGSVAALAVCRALPVGVDVEVRTGRVVPPAAMTLLSADEVESVNACPPDRRETEFLRCWTRKEAFAKVDGYGLGEHVRGLTLPPGAVVRGCRVLTTEPVPDVVVSVAAPGRRWAPVWVD